MEPGDIIKIENMEEIDEELLKVITNEGGSDVTYKIQVTLYVKGLKIWLLFDFYTYFSFMLKVFSVVYWKNKKSYNSHSKLRE